ncbi:uncharacterized protein [Periplaneta americana]|uniref:uncharacterized protein n=1 Tax=Periplaneta americana TaxID=6978 RepID=UPI0037E99D31
MEMLEKLQVGVYLLLLLLSCNQHGAEMAENFSDRQPEASDEFNSTDPDVSDIRYFPRYRPSQNTSNSGQEEIVVVNIDNEDTENSNDELGGVTEQTEEKENFQEYETTRERIEEYDTSTTPIAYGEYDELNTSSTDVYSDMLEKINNLTFIKGELEGLESKVGKILHQFLGSLDDETGNRSVTIMHEYMKEFRVFLKGYESLENFVNKYNTSGNITVDGFYDLHTYNKILTYNESAEKAVNDLQSVNLKYGFIWSWHQEILNRTNIFNEICNVSYLEKNIDEKEREIQFIKEFANDMRVLRKFIENNNLSDIYLTDKTNKFLNPVTYDSFATVLQNEREDDKNIVTKLLKLREAIKYMETVVSPCTKIVLYLFGIIGNGILLLIFIRHKEMRTSPNVMLINLAFGEFLSLTVSMPIAYIYYYATKGVATDFGCKAFTFFRVQGIGVSAYSLVVISIQRYVAMTQFLDRRGFVIGRKLKSFLLLLIVWIIGGIIAIPYTYFAEESGNYCYAGRRGKDQTMREVTATCGFIGVCLIPVVLNSVFSGLSAGHLRKSARLMPGEKMGQAKLQKSRVLSSNVLVGLVIIFAVCYIPYYLFGFLYVVIGFHMEDITYRYVISYTYDLIFCHSSLNPIALYVISNRYRYYFNKYLFCGKSCRSEESSSEHSAQTVTSTVDSNV